MSTLDSDPVADGYPECQKQLDVFEVAEAAVRRGLHEQSSSLDAEAGDVISLHLGWCQRCFMATSCLADMIDARYTGIAGGELLRQGRIISATVAGEPRRGSDGA